MPLLAGSIGPVAPSKAWRHALMLVFIAGLNCAVQICPETPCRCCCTCRLLVEASDLVKSMLLTSSWDCVLFSKALARFALPQARPRFVCASGCLLVRELLHGSIWLT